jgi:chromosome partitioning related protein ParA
MGHKWSFGEMHMRERKTTVISVVSTKGGCGKTTTSANLGGLIADLGFRVLVIDADRQPSLSKYYRLLDGQDSQVRTGLADVITRGGVIWASDIHKTNVGVDVLMSNLSDKAQDWLRERDDRLFLLKRAIHQPLIFDNYDYVIVDTQGSEGPLQRSAAMAADLMLCPLIPDLVNYQEFIAGTLAMVNSLHAMADLSPSFKPGPLHIFINRMDRTNNARAFESLILEDFQKHKDITLLPVVVPNSTVYGGALTAHMPVHQYDKPPASSLGVVNSGYETMHALVHALLPELKGMWADETLRLEAKEVAHV